jgi:hypothetical protein
VPAQLRMPWVGFAPAALILTLVAPGPPADLLLDGAAVYTMDAARSWAEAVAVRDGRIC